MDGVQDQDDAFPLDPNVALNYLLQVNMVQVQLPLRTYGLLMVIMILTMYKLSSDFEIKCSKFGGPNGFNCNVKSNGLFEQVVSK
jgi:hypothetical protein